MAKATAAKSPAHASGRNAGAKGKAGSAKRGVAALDSASGAARAAAVLGGKTGTIDRADRIAAGRALRKNVPRDAHGDWQPAPDRPDPVAVLVAQGESRVPQLPPIRYGRMAESEFGFFRGAAAGIAADLASTPSAGHTGQLRGAAHLGNFGRVG